MWIAQTERGRYITITLFVSYILFSSFFFQLPAAVAMNFLAIRAIMRLKELA